jgi:hypothetical protein
MGAVLLLQEIPRLLLFLWLAVLCFVAGAGHGKLAWRLLIASGFGAAASAMGLLAGTLVPILILWLTGRAAASGPAFVWVPLGACILAFFAAFGEAFRRLVWSRRPDFERSRSRPEVYAAGAALLIYLGYLVYSISLPVK